LQKVETSWIAIAVVAGLMGIKLRESLEKIDWWENSKLRESMEKG